MKGNYLLREALVRYQPAEDSFFNESNKVMAFQADPKPMLL